MTSIGEGGEPTHRYYGPRHPLGETVHVQAAISPEGTGATTSERASHAPHATKTRKAQVRMSGASLVVVMAVLGVLTWACTAPSQTDEGTSSASISAASSESTETYTDSVYGYSFDYPADWLSEDASYYLGGDPGTAVQLYAAGTSYTSYAGVIVSCIELESPFDESMLPEIRTELLDTMEEEGRSPQVEIRGPLRATTVGGLKGYEYMFLDASEGYASMLQAYYVYDEQVVYSLVLEAAEAVWEENQTVFSIIVNSFKPGTGY